MKKIFIILFIGISVGCQNNASIHENHAEGISHTIITDKTELFVEFNPLVVGETISFAAHFTDMSNFKAIKEGRLTVSLIKEGKGIRQTVESTTSPGIFRPSLQAKEKGIYQLIFELKTNNFTDKITIDNVVVYANIENAILENTTITDDNDIAFLKEQAWKIDFEIKQISKGNIHQIIKTSGEIEGMQGDEIIITAKTAGIVFFNGNTSIIGNKINTRNTIFTISGNGITENNTQTNYIIAKSNYEKAKSDYERGNELLKDKIISQKSFNKLEVLFKISETNYTNISSNYSNLGIEVKSSNPGFIKDILVNEGQFVESGTPLAVITKNQKLLLRADISQKYFNQIANIKTANFKTVYSESIYDISDLNGSIISYGKNISSHNNYIPVYFEIDNKGDLLSGSFVEVFLKTNILKNKISIPISALMSDYENYYVYIQKEGETFEKRSVTLGVNDGKNIQITSGLESGEWLVTKGAYQIKIASMSSTIPSHGHEH